MTVKATYNYHQYKILNFNRIIIIKKGRKRGEVTG